LKPVNGTAPPGKLHDLELGLQKKEAAAAFGATFYYMKYTDQLVLTGKLNDVGAYTRTNIENSYRLGVELEGSAALKNGCACRATWP
jgi:iron complex outermembrane receptor protein